MITKEKIIELFEIEAIEQGDLYLIEYLCFDRFAEAVVKNCSIPDVSHQRELLVAFCKYLETVGGDSFAAPEFLADDFLSNQ